MTSNDELSFNPPIAQHHSNYTPYFRNMLESNFESSTTMTTQIDTKKSFYSYPKSEKSPSNIIGKWSAWSSYSDCENSCIGLRQLRHSKVRLSTEATLSYSEFKGLKVSKRSCKFVANTSGGRRSTGSGKCIGPTHRYQQCPSLQVMCSTNSWT